RETRKSLRLFGVWPPGRVIELGMFGRLDGDLFHPLGHITKNFNAPLSKCDVTPKLQIEFKSAGAREMRGGGSAAVGTEVTTGVQGKIRTKLTFEHGGSTYFRAKDTVYSAIDN